MLAVAESHAPSAREGFAPLGTVSRSVNAQASRTESKIEQKSYRYRLLRHAQRILYDPDLRDGNLPVCWCGRTLRPLQQSISVKRAADGSGARFAGLILCGSVWTCPVCSHRITEARRRELSQAMARALELGHACYLMTLTHHHEQGTMLFHELQKQARALKHFKNSRTYKRLLGSPRRPGAYRRAGSVRSLEATHGINGWHSHAHELVFCGPGFACPRPDDDGLCSCMRERDDCPVSQLKGAWIESLRHADLHSTDDAVMWQHALAWHDGSKAAEYIAKMGHDLFNGLSAEITRGHAKIGRRKLDGLDAHYTPFQLLAWAAAGDAEAAYLFGEYAHAFKGKRMLTWTPGLKLLLGILEKRDDELVDSPLPQEQHVGELSVFNYGVLLSREMLGDFLSFVARCCHDPTCSQADIDAFMQWVILEPHTADDWVRYRSGLAPFDVTNHSDKYATKPATLRY